MTIFGSNCNISLCVFQEPKKLVRYRDNKIVSLKGERFTEVKSENAEETTKKSSSVRPGKTY